MTFRHLKLMCDQNAFTEVLLIMVFSLPISDVSGRNEWIQCLHFFSMLGSILLIWTLVWTFGEVVAVLLLHTVSISHQIILHSLVREKDDGQRPKGPGCKIGPPSSFTKVTVEHTRGNIRQWKWHSKWHVFSHPQALKMLVLIDSR